MRSEAPLVGHDGVDLVLGVHGLRRVHAGGLGRLGIDGAGVDAEAGHLAAPDAPSAVALAVLGAERDEGDLTGLGVELAQLAATGEVRAVGAAAPGDAGHAVGPALGVA